MDSREISLLGTAIRARRVALALTQQDLAELAGVATRTVHEIERGKPSIRLSGVIAVLDALGLELTLRVRGAGGSWPAAADEGPAHD